jgi:hypothetical protein
MNNDASRLVTVLDWVATTMPGDAFGAPRKRRFEDMPLREAAIAIWFCRGFPFRIPVFALVDLEAEVPLREDPSRFDPKDEPAHINQLSLGALEQQARDWHESDVRAHNEAGAFRRCWQQRQRAEALIGTSPEPDYAIQYIDAEPRVPLLPTLRTPEEQRQLLLERASQAAKQREEGRVRIAEANRDLKAFLIRLDDALRERASGGDAS